jgi:uncharacterized protein (DUF1015 family)
MAEVKPLRALHYDLGRAGALDRLTAPPYDVIDAAKRAELASRSPYNVVEVDLPEGSNRYERAARLLDEWKAEGILVQDADPALWALTQTYSAPDGSVRTRHGFFCRVRITDYGPGLVRPHERTHPAAKEDRLRLMRATKANLSAIFALYPDPDAAACSALEPATQAAPWGEVTDEDGTTHRLWRVEDAEAIEQVEQALSHAELLIADGHHRYETARTYADEVGGEGAHRYVLMCLVSMSDPGLTIMPTHRLIRGLDGSRRERLRQALERQFRVSPVGVEGLAPDGARDGGLPVYGYFDRESGEALRLELASPAIADSVLAGHSEAYRRLDTAVLEKLVLEQALGMSDDDISHERGLGYARDLDETLRLMRSGEYDAAFLLRPTPVEQVRAVAEAGETMPPKSTYFFPKLLSGLLFNPLT